jgi:class 3 adenylate cyclase
LNGGVPRTSSLDVLLTLLDAPVDGGTIRQRLADAGKRTSPAPLLAQLLRLEASGHVEVRRDDGYTISLTSLGSDAVADLAPGRAVEVALLMVDLVGFVPFTAHHGDDAAQRAAQLVQSATASALAPWGGRVVKSLGDGVLACAPAGTDVHAALTAIAASVARPEAGAWQLRAALHVGRPIELRGDLFGHDVNLVARLCDLAKPNELVCSAPDARDAELVAVRGLADPVAIVRRAL